MDPKLVQDINGAMPAFKTGQNLQNDTRDMIFKFLQTVQDNRQAECGERIPFEKLLEKLNDDLVDPLIKQYPDYTFWILGALEAGTLGEHFPVVKTNSEYATEKHDATIAKALARGPQAQLMLRSSESIKVFAAAKGLGMINDDVPETAENFSKLQHIIKVLDELNQGL